MAVIIQNVSESHDIPYGTGVQYYELRINKIHKANFTHLFEAGLAQCLREAADALEQEEHEIDKDDS